MASNVSKLVVLLFHISIELIYMHMVSSIAVVSNDIHVLDMNFILWSEEKTGKHFQKWIWQFLYGEDEFNFVVHMKSFFWASKSRDNMHVVASHVEKKLYKALSESNVLYEMMIYIYRQHNLIIL